jgi:hypothetical protein
MAAIPSIQVDRLESFRYLESQAHYRVTAGWAGALAKPGASQDGAEQLWKRSLEAATAAVWLCILRYRKIAQ